MRLKQFPLMYVRDVGLPGVLNICVISRYSFTLCICCVITQSIATIIPQLTNYRLIVCTRYKDFCVKSEDAIIRVSS